MASNWVSRPLIDLGQLKRTNSLPSSIKKLLTSTWPMRYHRAGLQQGSKKTPSGCPGQVDFHFGQVTFSPSLPDRQGPKQAVRRLIF